MRRNSPSGPLAVVIAYLALVLYAALSDKLPLAVFGLYLAASVLTFFTYAFDKSAAQRNQSRTRESTLHLFSLVGGWPGALIAQQVLRHKSKKRSFQSVFRATVVLNSGALLLYAFLPR